MKRLHAHAVFAALALACAAAVALQALHLQRANHLNAAVAAASVPAAPTPAASASVGVDTAVAAERDDAPEVRLARANALAQAGAHDEAFKRYSALIAAGHGDALARHALYNLGNLLLRQALGAGGAHESAPLVELAKQRYRDLLRLDPADWDARFNLERALRLAPEEQSIEVQADNEPVERRRVQLRGMVSGELP